jgi:hypothetical protein
MVDTWFARLVARRAHLPLRIDDADSFSLAQGPAAAASVTTNRDMAWGETPCGRGLCSSRAARPSNERAATFLCPSDLHIDISDTFRRR